MILQTLSKIAKTKAFLIFFVVSWAVNFLFLHHDPGVWVYSSVNGEAPVPWYKDFDLSIGWQLIFSGVAGVIVGSTLLLVFLAVRAIFFKFFEILVGKKEESRS